MNPSTAAPAAAAPAASAAATDWREFLAFRLGADEYGIDMLRVHEIRSYERPSRVADAPEFVKGVINLRGVIVPIVDLRVRLQLQVAQYDALTVVIVLQVGPRVMGVVVDAVSEVIALQPDQLRPAVKRKPTTTASAKPNSISCACHSGPARYGWPSQPLNCSAHSSTESAAKLLASR